MATHLCWKQPTLALCELLLERGKANLKETEPKGNTALMIAAHQGHASTVALLLSKGARVDITNKKGFTPLLSVAQKGHTEVCELLLERGDVNIEEKTSKGNTPLNLAAVNGHASTDQTFKEG